MLYLSAMVVLAWATVFSGAYIVYPGYRAIPPADFSDLSNYPQRLLMSSRNTSGWHSLGMEWKEHVAWLAPISITMVAYVFAKYGPALGKLVQIRHAILALGRVTAAAFVLLALGVLLTFPPFMDLLQGK